MYTYVPENLAKCEMVLYTALYQPWCNGVCSLWDVTGEIYLHLQRADQYFYTLVCALRHVTLGMTRVPSQYKDVVLPV